MPEIKICGITKRNEINILNNMDVDFAGFVFADSKRKVNFLLAKKLIEKLNKSIKTVGIFVNAPLNEIKECLEVVKIDIIQLHGDEDMEYILKLKNIFHGEIWKSLSIKNGKSLDRINNYEQSIVLLFDTYSREVKGGSGEKFNWKLIQDFSEKRKIVLAGGLTPENVSDAISKTSPQIVDVSSGVEVDGKKDPIKIKRFVRSVKRNES